MNDGNLENGVDYRYLELDCRYCEMDFRYLEVNSINQGMERYGCYKPGGIFLKCVD